MLNVREKMIELFEQADFMDAFSETTSEHRGYIADHLIANGVTVRDDAEWKRFAQQNLRLLGARVYGHDEIFEHNVSARTCHTQTRERAFIDGYLYGLDCVAAMISSCPNCGADMIGEEHEND